MIVRSFSEFDQLFDFDPRSNDLVDIAEHGGNKDEEGIVGFLGDIRLILYRVHRLLLLNIDGSNIMLNEDVKSRLGVKSKRYELTIESSQDQFIISYYFDRDQFLFDGDTTGFVEEEHFNFGLFIHNIISNSERQNRMFVSSQH